MFLQCISLKYALGGQQIFSNGKQCILLKYILGGQQIFSNVKQCILLKYVLGGQLMSGDKVNLAEFSAPQMDKNVLITLHAGEE